MKTVLKWLLGILCAVIIGLAIFTLTRSFLHRNDDHSAQALLGYDPAEQVSSQAEAPAPVAEPMPEDQDTPESGETEAAAESPLVTISLDKGATAEDPTVTATATFTGIQDSIQADINWYLDGQLIEEMKDRLLVEGSTVETTATLDLSDYYQYENATISLEASFDGSTVAAVVVVPTAGDGGEEELLIRTTDIPVDFLTQAEVYEDSELTKPASITIAAGDVGYMLDYENLSDGRQALKLQFTDRTQGWVDSDACQITEEDCTTDEDYTEEQKTGFVNDTMNYSSNTGYLVWVSLYTQKVNVFAGTEGSWKLEKCFDCATGVNSSPTTTGIFAISSVTDRWNLGATYVEPVLVFNGGTAFTSRPYDADTDEIADETMGKPASGGGVRLMEDDIDWMLENVPVGSTVVVY